MLFEQGLLANKPFLYEDLFVHIVIIHPSR